MIMPFALTIFCGGVLAFFTLPDHDTAARMLTFSTAISIMPIALVIVGRALSRKLRIFRPARRSVRLPASIDDDFGPVDLATSGASEWSTSGVNPSDAAMAWQYRQNDTRLGRFN